jgi:ferredoxin-type protein NapF
MSVTAPVPDPGRRALLRGARLRTPRPPHALAEEAFVDRCTRCGDCIAACPEGVLLRGDGGFPRFEPALGACTFCMACVDACEPRALDAWDARPWTWHALAGEACLLRAGVACTSCRDACTEDAVAIAPRLPAEVPRIDATRCSGCGACVAACPASAVALVEAAA